MSGARRLGAGLALAVLAARPVTPAAAASPPIEWRVQGSVEGGYTSEAFPGYPGSTSDRFGTFAVGGGMRARPGRALRVEWLVEAAADRYARWEEHDEQRYQTELRVRSGRLRVRGRGRFVPRTMLYPDALGGALYRDREGLLGIDLRLASRVTATLEARSEGQRYDLRHAGRTQTRTRWGFGLAVEPRAERRLELQFENEQAVADDSNYDFRTNRLTLSAASPVGPLSVRMEGEIGLRNYFPASIFASNYRRQDHTGAVRLELRRALRGKLGLAVRDEFNFRDSTRPGREFRVNTISVALDGRLGR